MHISTAMSSSLTKRKPKLCVRVSGAGRRCDSKLNRCNTGLHCLNLGDVRKCVTLASTPQSTHSIIPSISASVTFFVPIAQTKLASMHPSPSPTYSTAIPSFSSLPALSAIPSVSSCLKLTVSSHASPSSSRNYFSTAALSNSLLSTSPIIETPAITYLPKLHPPAPST
eukprot:IDg20419t1